MSQTRKMGFASVFLLGINSIIGSGIFLLPGELYKAVGRFSPYLILLAAASSIPIILCYAKMAATYTETGGAWFYAYEAFGRYPGFQIGIFSWLLGVITLAAEIAAFINIASVLWPVLKTPSAYMITSIVLILLLLLINLIGEKATQLADNISSAMKILMLALFIGVGLVVLHFSGQSGSVAPSGTDVNGGFSTAFYMFSGFAFLPTVASDMQNPGRDIPRALLAVILTVAGIYFLVQWLTISQLGAGVMNQASPVVAAFEQLVGPLGKQIMTLGVMVSILGVTISTSFNTPFVASSLASEEHLLPAFFGKQTKSGTPWVAILITHIVAVLLLLSRDYLFLVSCVVMVSLIQYVTTSAAAFKYQKPQSKYTLPGGKMIPVISLIVCVYLFAGLKLNAILLGVGIFILSILLYWADKRYGTPRELNHTTK
ncbi:APC family permease [Secundilactobacillus paracollinoides]|uniref:APC family permease n=1 Tax=Secundilactobacillus paracollinoides TaxID=240427 RepID=UPI003F477F70